MDNNCAVCGSLKITRLRVTLKSVSLYKCAQCGLVFCSPQPPTDSLSAGPNTVLTDEAFTQGLLDPSTRSRYIRLSEARYERYRSTLGRDRFRLLEVGCGSAGLATTFQRLGVDYFGIDIDPRVVDAAKIFGVSNVRNIDLFDLDDTTRYDVICFSQVLEHIKFPDQFVRKIVSLLVADGLVHCDVPNHRSLPSLLYRLPINPARWGAITYPNHLFAYSKKTLHTLLGKSFSINVFDATVDDPLWGQAINQRNILAKYSSAFRLLRGGSLLVAYGQRRSHV
jgi:SAM-dependent methyltransferase